MSLIHSRRTAVAEFAWRVLYVLLAAIFILGALGALVDYWVHIHAVYIEGVVLFWTSLVAWIIALLILSSRSKELGVSRGFAVVFWTGLVWVIVIGLLASGKHCDGSLAEYLHLGELEYCTGP
jgi:hypothetical protein